LEWNYLGDPSAIKFEDSYENLVKPFVQFPFSMYRIWDASLKIMLMQEKERSFKSATRVTHKKLNIISEK